MAQKVEVTLVSDLDGVSPADETVSFGLDGQAYEIDLPAAEVTKLRKALAKYADAARTIATRRPHGNAGSYSGKRRRVDRRGTTTDLAVIRDWARHHGWPDINNRGRIPAEIEAAYHAERAQLPAAPAVPNSPVAKPAKRTTAAPAERQPQANWGKGAQTTEAPAEAPAEAPPKRARASRGKAAPKA
jgi:hypothetical protein